MQQTSLKLALAICMSLLCLACTTTPSLMMKLETPTAPPKILLGQFVGSLALVQGDPKNAEIYASDGLLKCRGHSNNGQFSTDMIKNRVTHTFAVTCSNGISGQIVMNISAAKTVEGVGVGTFDDGSRVKVVIGDLSGNLNW